MTEAYTDRNAGTGNKTLVPAVTIKNSSNADVTANYNITLVNFTAGTINPKALTVSGITAASTIYDGTTTAKLGGTAAFLAAEVPGTGTTSDGAPYTVDSVSPGTVTGTLAASNVGTQNVTTSVAVTGSGNGNYTVPPQAGLTQQIMQKALTITANAQSKSYGATVAFGSGSTAFTSTGLQNSQTIGTVTLACSGGAATAAVSGSP